MTLRSTLTTVIVAAIAAFATVASAQDMRALMDRIDRLQRDVDVLQRRTATGSTGSAASSSGGAVITPADGFVGQTEARFSSLETQSREQTGRLEEIQFKLRQLETRIERLVGDMEFRFSQLEKGGSGGAAPSPLGQAAPSVGGQAAGAGAGTPTPPASSGAPGNRLILVPSGTSSQALGGGRTATPGQPAAPQQAAVTPAQPVTLPPGSPEAQYEFAYGVLLQAQRDQTDFGSAEQAMRAFVQQHPNHRLAGNAQYWLGETYYVRKDYQNAAIAFGEGLKKYPSADKGPDNMLRFGMSLAQLNRKPDACATFGEISKRYPAASSNVKQGAQRERQRLSC